MMRAWRTGLAVVGFLYVPGGAAASAASPFAVSPVPAAARSAATATTGVRSDGSAQVQAARARPARAACRLAAGSPPAALTSEPWAQRRLDFTAAWPLTTGRDIA